MNYPKIAYFLSHPVQYISPLLKETAKKFEVHVYYFSDASIKGNLDKGFGRLVKWDIPLLDGYNYTFIKNYSVHKSVSNKFLDLINPGVVRFINKERSKIIVVNGWMYFSVLLTIIYGKIRGKKIWMRAENPLNHELRKSRKTIYLKKLFLQHGLFKLVDKFLYIGSDNKRFFEYYGVKEEKLVYTPYSVDNNFFNEQFTQYSGCKQALLEELHLPIGKKIILFTAKYIEQKRPLDLLKAFYKITFENAVLVMVGDGPLRKDMEEYIERHQILNVVLTGFVNQSAISKYYAVADVFVMCSGMGETWGLSVNEAMNFSLPVIVSETCGCSYDLVRDGENGFTFPEGDLDELSKHIDTLLKNELFAKKAGALSREIINNYTIKSIVDNLLLAIEPI